ncbi:MAG: Hsp20/alpha crystallin family protein [Cyclobacteriaceae bacterium]
MLKGRNRKEMKVADKLLIKNLAKTAELVNKINGGMAQPAVWLKKSDQEWMLKMRVPGVSVDNIKIEVKDGFLFVFQNIGSETDEFEIPYMIEMLNLTNKINQDLIYAEYDEGEIRIHLPFDELASDFEREIEIIRR